MRTAVVSLLASIVLVCSCTVAARNEAELQTLPTPQFPESFTVVPTNVKPVLFDQKQRIDLDALDFDVSFLRRFEDGSEVALDFTRIEQAPFEPDAFLVDPGPLEPGEQLFIDSACDDCNISGSWTVGEERDDEPLEIIGAVGSVIDATAFGYGQDRFNHYSINVRLAPLNGEGLFRFTGDEVNELVRAPPEGLEDGTRNIVVSGGEARRTCFVAVARDVAGNETPFPELCADLSPAVNANSCAAAGAGPMAFIGLALFIRRRRTMLGVLMIAAGAAQAAPEPSPRAPEAPFPFGGSTIPTNARIVFFGEPHDDIRFERVDRDLVLSFTQETARSDFNEQMFIVNPGELEPGEVIIILPSCPICDASQVFEFTVAGVVDETPPNFVLGPVSEIQVLQAGTVNCVGIEAKDDFGVSATLPPVVDDSGAVLVRIESSEGNLKHERADDPTQPVNVGFDAAPGALREACATVTAIDVAGNEAPFDEPICAEVGGGGCTQSSAPALLAVLALFLRRRRRPA